MLRISFTIIFFFIIALFGVWLEDYNFPIHGEYNGYLIETTALKLFLIVIFFFIVFYGVGQLLSWITNSPARISARLQKNKHEQGYKDLMGGFSALASGDIEYARKLANRADKELENQPLVKLLQAQASVLGGNSADAEKYYTELSQTEGAKAIGYRGLIAQAIQNDEFTRALELSEDFLKLNPRSKWVNEAVIDLSLRNADFERGARYIKKAHKSGALNKIEHKIYSSIINYLLAKEDYEQGRIEAAAEHLKEALKDNPKFLPAAIMYTDALVEMEQDSKAQDFIEKFWKAESHPRLAEAYGKIFSAETAEKKLRKAERLLKIQPKSLQGILFYAKIAMENGKNKLAVAELKKALAIRETKSIYGMLALAENKEEWAERAEIAEEDKCWHCIETGMRYNDWQPFSDSGNFNTIVWDYPPHNSSKSSITNLMLIK